MSFQVPQPDDEFHNYEDSSQDENRSSQGTRLYVLCLVSFFYSFLLFIFIVHGIVTTDYTLETRCLLMLLLPKKYISFSVILSIWVLFALIVICMHCFFLHDCL